MPKKILFIGESHGDAEATYLLQEFADAALKSGKTPCILLEGYGGNYKYAEKTFELGLIDELRVSHSAMGIRHYGDRVKYTRGDLLRLAQDAFEAGKICVQNFAFINAVLAQVRGVESFLIGPDRRLAEYKFMKFAKDKSLKIDDLEPEIPPEVIGRECSVSGVIARDKGMAMVVIDKLRENDDLIVLCGAGHLAGVVDNIAKAYERGGVPAVEIHAITKERVTPPIRDAQSVRDFSTSRQALEEFCRILDYGPSSEFAVESAYGVSAAARARLRSRSRAAEGGAGGLDSAATRAAGGGWGGRA